MCQQHYILGFLAMELELRTHLQLPHDENFIQQATSAIKGNEDLLFFGQC